jgi:hypothetical protein
MSTNSPYPLSAIQSLVAQAADAVDGRHTDPASVRIAVPNPKRQAAGIDLTLVLNASPRLRQAGQGGRQARLADTIASALDRSRTPLVTDVRRENGYVNLTLDRGKFAQAQIRAMRAGPPTCGHADLRPIVQMWVDQPRYKLVTASFRNCLGGCRGLAQSVHSAKPAEDWQTSNINQLLATGRALSDGVTQAVYAGRDGKRFLLRDPHGELTRVGNQFSRLPAHPVEDLALLAGAEDDLEGANLRSALRALGVRREIHHVRLTSSWEAIEQGLRLALLWDLPSPGSLDDWAAEQGFDAVVQAAQLPQMVHDVGQAVDTRPLQAALSTLSRPDQIAEMRQMSALWLWVILRGDSGRTQGDDRA